MSSNEDRLARLQQDAAHELAQWQSQNRKLEELQADASATEGAIHAQERTCSRLATKVNGLYREVTRQQRLIQYIADWKRQYRP